MGLLGGGLSARPATLDDALSILQLILLVDEAELGQADMTEDGLVTDLTMPQVDLARDSLVVTTDDGDVVGYLLTTTEGGNKSFVDSYSHPDQRAGTNLDEFLLREGIRRARESRAAAGGGPWRVLAWSVDRDGRLPVIRGLGFQPVRHFIRMRRDLTDLADVAPPDGIRLRNPDSEDDLREVHRVSRDAFADHWDHDPESWEEFHHRKVARETFDPSLWWLAEDVATGRALGSLIGRDEGEIGAGWVAMVGVRREGRGRGIAGALLRASFQSLAARDLPRVELTVDADSLTGATRLYEREGMHRAFVLTRNDLELTDG